MAEKKEGERRDEKGVRKQSYRRFQEGRDYEPTEADQTAAMCDMFLKGFLQIEDTPEGQEVQRKPGRPRKYEKIEEFNEVVEKYINYIKDKAFEGVKLIPDIEGFCSFAGISRDTLNDWERSRSGEYSDTIKRFKTAIASYKKQLALTGKIPPIVFATDFNNNHGYVQQHTLEVQQGNKTLELPTREEVTKRLPKTTQTDIDTDIDLSDL